MHTHAHAHAHALPPARTPARPHAHVPVWLDWRHCGCLKLGQLKLQVGDQLNVRIGNVVVLARVGSHVEEAPMRPLALRLVGWAIFWYIDAAGQQVLLVRFVLSRRQEVAVFTGWHCRAYLNKLHVTDDDRVAMHLVRIAFWVGFQQQPLARRLCRLARKEFPLVHTIPVNVFWLIL